MATELIRRKQPPPHGDRRRYHYWLCRCDACREGARLYDKRHREGRAPSQFVDQTGTMRRVRGLVAMGYNYPRLAAELGCHLSNLHLLATRTCPRGVLTRTAEQVRHLAHDLAGRPAPTGTAATRARNTARRNGWWPLAAWDDIDDPDCVPNLGGTVDLLPDPVAVEQLLTGRRRLHQAARPDRVHAVATLADRGLDVGTIAHQLRTSTSAVRGLLAAATEETADAA